MTQELLEKLNFPAKTIKRIFNNKDIQENSAETLYKHTKENIKGFFDYGFCIKDIIIIINKNPRCLTINFSSILEVLNYLETLGFNKHRITKMIKLSPKIFDRNPESIEKRLERIENLGYSRDEVLKMFGGFSAIEESSINKLSQMKEDLQTLGYTEEEIHNITVNFSQILTFSFERVSNMIEYLKSINLDKIILHTPSRVMQSVEKTYARYMYFKEEKDEIVTVENSNKIFEASKRFQKRFGVNDEYLQAKYPYIEIQERKINNV